MLFIYIYIYVCVYVCVFNDHIDRLLKKILKI